MFYKYTVEYYNEYEDKEVSDEGIVFSNNFGDAASHVAEEYGNGVFKLTIQEAGSEEGSYCFNKDDINYAFQA